MIAWRAVGSPGFRVGPPLAPRLDTDAAHRRLVIDTPWDVGKERASYQGVNKRLAAKQVPKAIKRLLTHTLSDASWKGGVRPAFDGTNGHLRGNAAPCAPPTIQKRRIIDRTSFRASRDVDRDCHREVDAWMNLDQCC